MAIKRKDETGYVYLAINSSVFTNAEKVAADSLYKESKESIKGIDDMDLLQLWLKRGAAALKIHEKHQIRPNEEIHFWEMLYDAADIKLPDRSKNLLARNEFWLGAKLSKHLPLKDKWLNNWTIWREMFEAKVISQDERIAEWMISKAITNEFANRNDIRVLLNKVRNRLKHMDTSVLERTELFSKLDELDKSRP